MLHFLRSDILVGEPVILGPVVAAGDFLIISSRQLPKVLEVDVLQAIDNADETAYSAYCSCSTILATLIAFSVVRSGKRRMRRASFLKRFTEKLLNTVWHMISTIVDQEHYALKSETGRVLWLTFVIATFIAVFGILMNCMSTDIVQKIPPEQVETLNDLFLEKFKHIAPKVMRNYFLYPFLVRTKSNPSYGKLLSMISGKNSSNLVEMTMTMDNMMMLQKMIMDRIKDNKACLLLSEFIFMAAYLSFFCRMREDIHTRVHMAKNRFGGGIMFWMYGKQIHPLARKVLDYNLRIFNEGDLMLPTADFFFKKELEKSLGPMSLNSSICVESVKATLSSLSFKEDEENPDGIIVVIPALYHIINFCCWLTAGAFFILVLEVSYRRINLGKWKWRRRKTRLSVRPKLARVTR